MDDLKIVFYIIVAIVWMVYNNYKKVSEAAKKRDISKPYEPPAMEEPQREITPPKPFEESIPEFWPREIPAPKPKNFSDRADKKIPVRPVSAPSRSRKPETLKRDPIRKERMSANYKFPTTVRPSREGGNLQPSKLVHFEDATKEDVPYNQIAEDIRNADFRQAIILSEVLQRPYI